MKLTTITLLTACFAASFGCFAQNVTISERNVPVEKIFRVIEAQTDYVFFYDYSVLNHSKKVSIQCKGVPLSDALALCFKDQPLTYIVRDKTIVVKTSELPMAVADAPQKKSKYVTIHGVISDIERRPIDNASISIKGTTRGVTTNMSGEFSIICEKGTVLTVTSIGYQTREIVAETKTLSIVLNLDVKPLEQLIVGGNVVPVKRKAEVSSVAIIDEKALQRLPYQNIEQIFRGLVPGANNLQPEAFEISQYQYGSGAVSIRGSGGFGGIGVVKVIIDGVEFASGSFNLNTIDKYNIERIEVVKGPGAATLYGTGAQGGVLLIFTKAPSRNTTDITVSASAGWQDSKWEHKGKFQQVHGFNIMQGYKNISYSIGGNINNSQTYMPDGQINQHAIYGTVKYVNDNWRITFSGRHYINNFVPSRNAFFDTSSAAFFNMPGYKLPDTTQGSITTDQVALNLGYQATKWWLHNLVLGWSENGRTVESKIDHPPLKRNTYDYQSPTFRYNNTVTIASHCDFRTNLIVGIDYTNYLNKYAFSTSVTRVVQGQDQQKNTGYFAQLNPSFKNRFFLTMGLRYDINRNFKSSVNPKIGATTNFKTGLITWKPRVSWGTGITPPGSQQRFPDPSTTSGVVLEPNPDLKPQTQRGWDYGVEIYSSNNKLKAEAAYYDNFLEDAIYTDVTLVSSVPHWKTVNAGKIQNRGWEFSANYLSKGLEVAANYAITYSILKEPQSGTFDPKDMTYPGEQMPFIAKYTSGVMAGYRFVKLFGKSDALSLAFNMTNTSGIRSLDYDRYIHDLAVFHDFTNITRYGGRYYVIDYPSITKINLNLDYQIIDPLDFFFQVRNIGNNTTGEYLNSEPSVGRGWLFGIKYHFNKTAGN